MSTWLFLCCLCVLPLAAESLDVGPVTSVVADTIWEAWKFINAHSDNLHDYKQVIQEKLEDIIGLLSAVEGRLLAPKDEILQSFENLPAVLKKTMKLDRILHPIQRIEEVFEGYKRLDLMDQFNVSNEQKFRNVEIINFSESIISDQPESLRANMKSLHRLVVADVSKTSDLSARQFKRFAITNDSSLFQLILEYFKKYSKDKCEVKMSSNQLLSYLFSIVQMAQLKAYTLIQLSWLVLIINNKGNFKAEAEKLRGNYLKRMSQQAQYFKESMKPAGAGFWKCDPEIHVEGETYTEVTKLMQGILINEMDLNEQKLCSNGCSFYWFTKQFSCINETFCSKPCKGNVVGCKFIDSTMEVFEAADSSTRRYDSITINRNETLSSNKAIIWNSGSKKSIIWNSDSKNSSRSNSGSKKSSSWYLDLKKLKAWIFGKKKSSSSNESSQCPFCFCYCDDSKDDQSDRYFNLRPVVSDTDNNRVVTGVKFIKRNRIIHLQIQQGELLPYGRINKTTIDWKPVDDYSIDGIDVKEEVDYHTLTVSNRAINLDYMMLKNGYMVTGLQWSLEKGRLNLKIWGNKFNLAEGKLLQSFKNGRRVDENGTKVPTNIRRSKVPLDKTDVPAKTIPAIRIRYNPMHFLKFTTTDLELDAGQTTIPFLDTQNVAPNPAMPLAGIGLYYKSSWGNLGGYIGPIAFTYDFTEQVIEHFLELNEFN